MINNQYPTKKDNLQQIFNINEAKRSLSFLKKMPHLIIMPTAYPEKGLQSRCNTMANNAMAKRTVIGI